MAFGGDKVEFVVAGIRIGTLRTYPVIVKVTEEEGKEVKQTAPFILTDKGCRFSVSRKDNSSNEDINVKISAKHIQLVEAHLMRGCPVIWIKVDDSCAGKIRNLCHITDDEQANFDPSSKESPEQLITVITKLDPLPLSISQSIQQIFAKMSRKLGHDQDSFFKTISQSECNNRLVSVSNITFMDGRSTEAKHQTTKKTNTKKIVESDSEWSSGSDSDTVEPDDKGSDAEGDTEVNDKDDNDDYDDDSDPEFKPHRKPKGCKRRNALDTRKSIKQKASLEMEPSSPTSQNTQNDETHSATEDATLEPMKKVHRARKSIPNRNRTVSIESQLRARVGSQTPLTPINDKTLSGLPNPNKRKLSEDNNTEGKITPNLSDNSQNLGGEPAKKKYSNLLSWTGSKRKKRIDSHSGSSSPVPMSVESNETNLNSAPQKSGTEPNNIKSKESKVQLVQRDMMSLKQGLKSLQSLDPLCTCVVPSVHHVNLQRVEGVKCMAIDNISGRLYGCHSLIKHPEMMRPSSKIPVLGLCDEHRERMVRHESCPGCGTFCCGGIFLVCFRNNDCPHRFHRDCMIFSGRSSGCPHCGGDASHVKEVNLAPYKDSNLKWILAGQNADKMERKKYAESRGRSARMGHPPTTPHDPLRIPGVKIELAGFKLDLAGLHSGKYRTDLEKVLETFKSDAVTKKSKFQPRQLMHYVKQGEITKVLQMLDDIEIACHVSDLNEALFESVDQGNVAITHLLLQAGADVNAKDGNGDTPLFHALHKQMKDVMFYLLTNHADVTVKDEEGMTCLHHAAKEGFIEGCHLLMTYGKAKINSLDDGGWTPIAWAAEHKQAKTARYLMQYGADCNVADKEGNICLQWAALSGNIEILLLCIQSHCQVNHSNTHGDTALHIAAREDHYNCVTALLAAGADPTLENKVKQTSVMVAPDDSMSWMSLKINAAIRKACFINGSIVPFNRERVLSTDLSRGYDKVPIMCVNAVDDAPCPTAPPHGFHYVTENVHTSQETRISAVISGIQSCDCQDSCETSSCVCGLISERCWYSKQGTLLPQFDMHETPLLFECNKMCKCSRTCTNRVVQNGIRYRLQVYRTHGMGWGLRALEPIPRGSFVCDYVGELITDAEADVREDDSYLFDLENKDGEMFCIDARSYGNVSRFINHLCEPNLIPVRVFVEHHDIRFPRLAFFTTRDISENEELGFDYGDRFWDVKCRQFTCHCGSPNCKYSEEAYKKKAQQQKEEEHKESGNNEAPNIGEKDECEV